jgi:hypothetical protein
MDKVQPFLRRYLETEGPGDGQASPFAKIDVFYVSRPFIYVTL